MNKRSAKKQFSKNKKISNDESHKRGVRSAAIFATIYTLFTLYKTHDAYRNTYLESGHLLRPNQTNTVKAIQMFLLGMGINVAGTVISYYLTKFISHKMSEIKK